MPQVVEVHAAGRDPSHVRDCQAFGSEFQMVGGVVAVLPHRTPGTGLELTDVPEQAGAHERASPHLTEVGPAQQRATFSCEQRSAVFRSDEVPQVCAQVRDEANRERDGAQARRVPGGLVGEQLPGVQFDHGGRDLDCTRGQVDVSALQSGDLAPAQAGEGSQQHQHAEPWQYGVRCVAYANKPGKQRQFRETDAAVVITDMHELAKALNARWDSEWCRVQGSCGC